MVLRKQWAQNKALRLITYLGFLEMACLMDDLMGAQAEAVWVEPHWDLQPGHNSHLRSPQKVFWPQKFLPSRKKKFWQQKALCRKLKNISQSKLLHKIY